MNSSVLVPRQDTEVLVEAVLPFAKDKDVLDLCTGSGCIAVSLSCLGGCRSVTASDISPEALKVAEENVRLNQAEVQLIESNLFDRIPNCYDIVVSNPPYIPSEVIEGLEPEVRDHDPRLALDGMADGLFFYRKICLTVRNHLKKDGILAVEIGHDQGAAVSEMFCQAGFKDVIIGKDLSGLDRYVWGRMTDR